MVSASASDLLLGGWCRGDDELEQPAGKAIRYCLRAAVQTQLAKEVLDVVAHGEMADGQTIGDDLARKALGHELEDFNLATRQAECFLGLSTTRCFLRDSGVGRPAC